MTRFIPPKLDAATLDAMEQRAATIYEAIDILSENPDANIRLNHIFMPPAIRSETVPYQNEKAAFDTMAAAEAHLKNAPREATSKIMRDWRKLIIDYAEAYAPVLAAAKQKFEMQQQYPERDRRQEINEKKAGHRDRKALNDLVTREAIEENFRANTPAEVVREMDARGEAIYGAIVFLAENTSPHVSLRNIFSQNEMDRERVRFQPDSQRTADSMPRVFGRIREAFGPTPPPQLEDVLENWRTLTEDFKGAMKAIRTGSSRG